MSTNAPVGPAVQSLLDEVTSLRERMIEIIKIRVAKGDHFQGLGAIRNQAISEVTPWGVRRDPGSHILVFDELSVDELGVLLISWYAL